MNKDNAHNAGFGKGTSSVFDETFRTVDTFGLGPRLRIALRAAYRIVLTSGGVLPAAAYGQEELEYDIAILEDLIEEAFQHVQKAPQVPIPPDPTVDEGEDEGSGS